MLYELVEWFTYGPFVRTASKLFIKKAEGIANLPEKNGYILAVNHNSYLDIILMSTLMFLKRHVIIKYIGKKELFTNKISKWYLTLMGQISVDRKLGSKQSLETAVSTLKKGDVIGIFPEGTRSMTGKIREGKTGVARLALWAKVPVVPVGIKGSFELMPKGTTIPKFKKNVIIKVGKPIYFDKYYKRKITKKLLRQITEIVMKEIAKLSGQRCSL